MSKSFTVGIVEWLKLFIKRGLILHKTNGFGDFIKGEFAQVASTLSVSGLLAL